MPTTEITTETTTNPWTFTPNYGPLRHYATRITNGRMTAPAGDFTDHTNSAARSAAYHMRVSGETFQVIADVVGFQHWHYAQRAVEAHARLTGRAMPRSYSRRTSTRATIAASGILGQHLLNRRFGIEIETGHGTARRQDTYSAATAMRDLGLDAEAESYNHSTRPHWKVTTDATVSGVEAVSPILTGDNGYEQIVLATRGLKAAGFTPSGGVHIHHDVTDFSTDQLANLMRNLGRVQGAIASFLTRSRATNRWCPIQPLDRFERLAEFVENGRLSIVDRGNRSYDQGWSHPTMNRYEFFNTMPLGTYGTVEFRGHGASLNPTKLRPWIAVGQAVVEYSRLGHTFEGVQTVDQMLEAFATLGLITTRNARSFRARVVTLHGTDAPTTLR